MDSLQNKIKNVIVESLNLEDISPEDIDANAPLFGEGLGLDSIDALELGLAIKKNFSVTLTGPSEEVRQHFYSVATLASFIRANQPQ